MSASIHPTVHRSATRRDQRSLRGLAIITAFVIIIIIIIIIIPGGCARPPSLPRSPASMPGPLPSHRTLTVAEVQKLLWPPGQRESFRPSTLIERQTVPALIAWLLAGPRPDAVDHATLAEWSGAARHAGFELAWWQVAGQTYWALVEQRSQRRGAGAYILRADPSPPASDRLILQAPHARFDIGTGAIAAELFFTIGVGRALFVNTTNRFWRPDGATTDPAAGNSPSRRRDSPADLCHRADHVFQDATLAAVSTIERAVVIQLHGFADDPALPDAIVSPGATRLGSGIGAAPALASGLAGLFDDVRRYPDEIAQLGGLTNAQGRALEQQPTTSFVHLELSSTTRRRLRESPDLRRRFASALDRMMSGEAP